MLIRRLTLLARLGLGASSLLCAEAHAIGLCEGGSTDYKLIEIAPRAGLLALSVEQHTCAVVESENSVDEKWQTLKTILVTDLELKEQGSYATDPKSAPSGDVKPAAAWQALRKDKGFRPIAEVALLPPGTAACRVERVALVGRRAVPLDEAPHRRHEFTEHRVGLRVTAGGRALPPLVLGTHALEAGDFPVWLVPLPGGVRSYAMLATCGGPPPGYFGEDDAGSCYARWQRKHADHPALKLPATCFPAPAR